MALTFATTIIQPVSGQTINAAATYTSAEFDLTTNAIAEQIFLYLTVAGFATTPAGNTRMLVKIIPVLTAGSTAYSDQVQSFPFTVTADQAYAFAVPVATLPQIFKVSVMNDTSQNTDASAVNLSLRYVKVTV